MTPPTAPSSHPEPELDALKFWSRYGRRGTTPQRRILPWDWDNLQPFSTTPVKTAWKVTILPHQLPLLLKGFLPVEKDKSPFLTALQNGDYQPGDWLSNVGFLSTTKNPKNKASEDKWFVYADGPDARGAAKLHLHRSWTGVKVIELDLQVECGEACITHISWEDASSGGEEEAKSEALIVCDWVLNVDLDAAGCEGVPKQSTLDLDQMAKTLHDATTRARWKVFKLHASWKAPWEASSVPAAALDENDNVCAASGKINVAEGNAIELSSFPDAPRDTRPSVNAVVL
ncbi:hypothetical protein PRZ48_012133 [Zasmidium cellare]|uniref:Uncharacterized protein n=1 Tax=Zasmidium cellare TaxID=395010 RepID=A0ABR0E4A1_ZASCE|nr:hypothetical protein PRZ48_012133 [Zasmidium cellare]